MGRYVAYPEYKDSGVQWLGEVPRDWELMRLRFALITNPSSKEIRIEQDQLVSFVPMDAVGEYGGIRLDADKELSEIGGGYTYFSDGDIVVAKITPCFENGKGALAKGLTNGIAFGTTELHVLRPNQNLHADFLFYLTISHVFRNLGEAEMYGAGGQKRVPDKFIKDFRAALPSFEDQQTIARFLDYKTAQIDALIARKEALLKKLAEKRTALISHAVTKGLDPSAPMKDSGVPWLGDIPAHWKILKLHHIARLNSGETITATLMDEEQEFPVYGGNGFRGYFNSYTHNGYFVLIGRQGALCGNINYATGKFWASEHAIVVSPTVTYKYRWLGELLRSMNLNQYSVSAAQPGLSAETIGRLSICLPPYTEQSDIANFIDKITTRIDLQAQKIQQAIYKLKEFRTALITQAVTGKIDLRKVPVPV